MMDMMGGGNGSWMWGGMWIFLLLFWVLIIAGVVFIVQSVIGSSDRQSQAPIETPLETLKRRYANGEIDQETFEKMKRDIRDGAS